MAKTARTPTSSARKSDRKPNDLMYADPADMLDPVSSPVFSEMARLKFEAERKKMMDKKTLCENLTKRAQEQETSKHWWEQNPVVYNEFAWAAMELLAARRREGRRARMLTQMEAWLNSIAAKVSAAAHLSRFILVRKKRKLNDYTWDIGVRFNDPVVRHRMMNLMGTEVVRLLDRDFMSTLANRLVERNCELIKQRIEERKNWELDRERQLVFDGKLPLEDGPPGFSEHPYFAIMSKVAEEVAKRKAKIEAHKTRKRLIPMFDYSIFASDFSENKVKESTSDISLIDEVLPDLNIVEAEKKNCELVLKKMVEREMIDIPGYERARYEHLQVKALRKAKTVEDMYKMAAKIFMTV